MLVVLYMEELFDLALQRTSLGHNVRLRRGHAEWKAGSTLQLQRIAHENLGLGLWTRTNESVPVTNRGDLLGIYDVQDENHARLVNLRIEKTEQSLDVSSLSGEGPDEEVADGTVLSNDTAGAGGGSQYQRVPNDEYATV